MYELKKRKNEFISGEELARTLGCSRTAIWKKVRDLENEGYKISSSPRRGYQLLTVPDLLLPLEIAYGLEAKNFGKEIHHFQKVDSTINKAKDLVAKQALPGTIVVAEEQSKGRGRLKREWASPKGGIWVSMILKPSFLPQDAPLITLAAANSLAKTIQDNLKVEAKIKWPNDVLISGKKVAGILTEMDAEPDRIIFVILSMGVNANVNVTRFPKELKKKSTSLKEILGQKINRVNFLQILLMNLEERYRWLEDGKKKLIIAEWKHYSTTLGKKVAVATAGKRVEGKAVDLSPSGALMVKTSSGEIIEVLAGDVSIL